MIKINGLPFEVSKFPNGESLIDFAGIGGGKWFDIDFYFDEDESLIHLMFIKKELDYVYPKGYYTLNIKYMPYARMDRRIERFAFTLKHTCEFINSLEFDRVIVNEAHSDMTLGLLNNAYHQLTSLKAFDKALIDMQFDPEKDFVVLPDAGAEKRYMKALSDYTIENTMVGLKKRDLQSGKIISFDLLGVEDMDGGRALIIDDLCSKGGTFLATANCLKDRNCSDIYLAVAHLENTSLEGQLFTSGLIKHVYATDSIFTGEKPENLTVLEV